MNRFRYAGEQYDAVTSQYYLRARYYNPVIGRFTQQDTYLGAGLNLYAYCDNNPLSYIDPSGHNPESAAGRQDIPPSYILEIPSVQRIIDTYSNNTNNYIDSSVQSQSNAIYGDATSGADAGTLAPAPNSTESAPVPTTPQTTALVPVAPMGSYPLVPVAPMGTYQVAPVAPMGSYPIVPYNANSNNPLLTRQSMDVSNAVNDAGGRTDRRPLMPMNLQFFAESGSGSPLQDIANRAAQEYNAKYNPTERAISKGYTGVKKTANGGVSFQGTSYMHIINGVETKITIPATGTRSGDFDLANSMFKFDDTPDGYVWHHLDDYNVANNTFTLELVLKGAHNASKPHSGTCAQYDAVHGASYNPPRKGAK